MKSFSFCHQYLLLGFVVLAGTTVCAMSPTSPSPTAAPGAEKSTKTEVLGLGARVLQDTTPVEQLDAYLDGFHFVHGNMGIQEEAHHYCYQMTEEFIQCAIYDGNGKEAKLIGVEHIISDRLYRGLPTQEQRLWHPHDHEVKSGLLIAPGLPQAAEHELMKKLVSTRGKTWHVWHTEKDPLPVGEATLMMGFTQDGQIRPVLIEERDRKFGISTQERRAQRADIPDPGHSEAVSARESQPSVKEASKPRNSRQPRAP